MNLSGQRRSLAQNASRAFTSGVGVAVILLSWEGAVSRLDVPLYVLPAPSIIGAQLVRDWALLVRHLQPTVIEAVGGFAIGNGIATALAALFVYTPLLVVWLGNGYAPKIAIAALISFFPTLVNMTRGFGAATPDQLELMHALAATPWQVFRLVRWPASLPYLFAALRIASTSSVLGAIVAEWIGSDRGLGYLIVAATFEYRVARLWATITVATGTAVVAFLAVVAAERAVVPWARNTVGA
ncbi:MAG: ABC transporter permease subunit [Proteobacteria bacterium]|nr:ABC transporter permease subunit [Pseudomonadota bacterium]